MKKTYKYILSLALIISSFFLLDSVYALTDSKICIYDFKGKNKNIHIIVRDDGSAYMADVLNYQQGNLLNWDKADIGGFSGKDYFLNNDYACPPYVVVNVDNIGANDVYASDKSTLSKIDSKIIGEVHCPLLGSGLLDGAPQKIKNAKSTYSFTVPKTCVCEANAGENNFKKSFSMTFTIDKKLNRPTVSLNYGGESNSENLYNWFMDDGGNEGGGDYSYVHEIVKTNSCPQYVVFSSGANYWVALADESNLKNVLHSAHEGAYAKCHEYAAPQPKSNSNTSSSSNSNTKKYSNVASNDSHNADFMVIDQYKQCGGKSGVIITNIPSIVPRITSTLYNTIMVLVPVVLIIMGTVDLVKGIMSQKEDEIKKGRDSFIKRLIGSVIIFLIVLIVKIFVGAVARDSRNSSRIVDCIDCFVSNSCDIMK